MSSEELSLGAIPLSLDDVVRIGCGLVKAFDIAPEGLFRAEKSWELASALVSKRPIYGRSTGVGANRDTAVEQDVLTDWALLRSHASATGHTVPRTIVRMTICIRLNQLLQGGSGIHPDIIKALQVALTGDVLPLVHATGGIGTGDLAALAEIALGLADAPGDAAWALHPGDALPFLSSNALTLAYACATTDRLRRWQARQSAVTALSFLAAGASTECLSSSVHRAHPQPMQAEAAAAVQSFLSAESPSNSRVQDSYGFRAYPQVAGALRSAATSFEQAIEIEISSAGENPLVSEPDHNVFHNGNFHAAAVALATDHVKLALASAAALSGARLTDLSNPEITGLTPFLADRPGASGIMLIEYNQASAQANLRSAAQPATLNSVVISRGTENHASFATQAIHQLDLCLDYAFDVLACELVAAHRAISMRPNPAPPSSDAMRYFRTVSTTLTGDTADRPLTQDLYAARALLDSPLPSAAPNR